MNNCSIISLVTGAAVAGVVISSALFPSRSDNKATQEAYRQTPPAEAPTKVARATKSTPRIRKASVASDVAVAPRSLSFVQDRLHNCGTVAMLVSWATANPREAASMVRRRPGGTYLVRIAGKGIVQVTASDLASARKARIVRTPRGSRWAEIVLTAFAKVKSGMGTPNFALTEWIYAGDIALFLTGRNSSVFEIKPELRTSSGRLTVGSAVAQAVLEKQLQSWRGKPAVAYTNRRIHIWSILGYDARRRVIHVRNPRHLNSVWMPLSTFRQKFQLVVYVPQRSENI